MNRPVIHKWGSFTRICHLSRILILLTAIIMLIFHSFKSKLKRHLKFKETFYYCTILSNKSQNKSFSISSIKCLLGFFSFASCYLLYWVLKFNTTVYQNNVSFPFSSYLEQCRGPNKKRVQCVVEKKCRQRYSNGSGCFLDCSQTFY